MWNFIRSSTNRRRRARSFGHTAPTVCQLGQAERLESRALIVTALIPEIALDQVTILPSVNGRQLLAVTKTETTQTSTQQTELRLEPFIQHDPRIDSHMTTGPTQSSRTTLFLSESVLQCLRRGRCDPTCHLEDRWFGTVLLLEQTSHALRNLQALLSSTVSVYFAVQTPSVRDGIVEERRNDDEPCR